MKKTFTIFYCCLSAIYALAQDPDCRDVTQKTILDSSFLSVTYDFTFAIDTLSDMRYTDRQRLDIGSYFIHYFSLLADKTDSTMYRARISKTQGGLNPRNWMAANEKDHYENYYFHYPGKGQLTVWTTIVNTEYIYNEPVPDIDWQLNLGESDTILSHQCYKATACFRGRSYEVWFTLEIPVQAGPWKFQGLPGLILKAKDNKGLFLWRATGISQTKNLIFMYDTKKQGLSGTSAIREKIISRAQLQKLQRKIWDDPIGLLEQHGKIIAPVARDGRTGKMVPVTEEMRLSFRKPYIPPLELE
jgi:GLPGLI family protein